MELSTSDAGMAIGLSREMIRLHVVAGRLPARWHGMRRAIRVHVDDLRAFAHKWGYPIDEEYLSRLANPEKAN
jgi:hypothetical protein